MRAIVGQQTILRAARSCGTARTSTRLAPYERARRGIALRAAGPRDLPAAYREREPATPALPRSSAAGAPSPTTSSTFSRCSTSDAAAARRRSLGRAAAAARDRSRAGHAAQTPRARRADRGHPALDHQGYRPRHRIPARDRATWRSCSSSSISISPRELADRIVRHGSRRGRAVGRFRPRSTKRRCGATSPCDPAPQRTTAAVWPNSTFFASSDIGAPAAGLISLRFLVGAHRRRARLDRLEPALEIGEVVEVLALALVAARSTDRTPCRRSSTRRRR